MIMNEHELLRCAKKYFMFLTRLFLLSAQGTITDDKRDDMKILAWKERSYNIFWWDKRLITCNKYFLVILPKDGISLFSVDDFGNGK